MTNEIQSSTQEPPAMPSKSSKAVPIKDETGAPLGYTIRLGAGSDAKFTEAEDPKGIRALADKIEGWDNFYVGDDVYEFSPENALALLNRFPFIAAQIKAAA